VGNAIKFTNSGEVIIDIRAYPLGGNIGGCLLELSVTDTGIGIEPSILLGLFQAFKQGSGGLSRQHGGVGLGLNTAACLAQLMGGSVDVMSTLGAGSVFTVKLPFKNAPSMKDAPSMSFRGLNNPVASKPYQSARVLLAERHTTTRQVLIGLLEQEGFQCVAVQEDEQAMEVLSQAKKEQVDFDIAFIDFNLPKLNGIEWVQQLNAKGLCRNTKLVLLMAGSSSDNVRDAFSAGFHGLLAKPVRKSELLQVSQRVLTTTPESHLALLGV